MSRERHGYKAYLLRLWQVRTDDEFVWRASLEDPHAAERIGFANLEALFIFLRQQTAVARDVHGDDDTSGTP